MSERLQNQLGNNFNLLASQKLTKQAHFFLFHYYHSISRKNEETIDKGKQNRRKMYLANYHEYSNNFQKQNI